MTSFLNRIARNLTFFASIGLTAGFLTSHSPRANAIPVDTAGTAMSGLWNIDAESGWGASVVHQYGTMFITIYTFDANRNPVWYAATNCIVANDRCRDAGMLKITNGDAVTTPWSGNRSIVPVGSLEMIFNTINGATMNFVIDGRSGTKTSPDHYLPARRQQRHRQRVAFRLILTVPEFCRSHFRKKTLAATNFAARK